MVMRIIIVDDEAGARNGLANYIDWGALDCMVAGVAASAKEALAQIEASPPELVITDIRMPVMDGMELASIIARRYPHTSVALLSGYAEFEYAQQALRNQVVDYLLKPVSASAITTLIERVREKHSSTSQQRQRMEQLSSSIHKNKELEGQIVLYQLLDKSPVSARSYGAFLQHFAAGSNRYVLALFHISPQRGQPAEDLPQLYDNVERLIETGLQGLPHTMLRCEGDRLYVVLHNPGLGILSIIKERCESIIEMSIGFSEISLMCVLGPLREDYRTLALTRSECDATLDYVLPGFESGVYMAQEVPSDLEPDEFRKMQSALFQCIEGGNRVGLEQLLEQVAQRLAALSFSLRQQKQVALLLGHGSFHLLTLSGFEPMEGAPWLAAFERGVEKTASPEPLWQELRRLCEEVMAALRQKATANTSIVERVQQHILHHYADELGLEALARQLAYVSPSYLSRLFNKKVGQPLSSYIAQVRMEKAAQLLQSTDLPVFQIAEKVGIHDPVYFSKMFKKYAGKAPKEFRRSS